MCWRCLFFLQKDKFNTCKQWTNLVNKKIQVCWKNFHKQKFWLFSTSFWVCSFSRFRKKCQKEKMNHLIKTPKKLKEKKWPWERQNHLTKLQAEIAKILLVYCFVQFFFLFFLQKEKFNWCIGRIWCLYLWHKGGFHARKGSGDSWQSTFVFMITQVWRGRCDCWNCLHLRTFQQSNLSWRITDRLR